MNLIGAGRVGQTLGKLLFDSSLVHVQSICNSSLGSAQSACNFIGAGTPVSSIQELPQADITLIAVPDNHIEAVCQTWAQTPAACQGSIVFHVSGALSSAVLGAAQERGMHTASIHPLKSFASPEQAYGTFRGTFCGVEGDAQALAVLCPMFEALGVDIDVITPEAKTLYHAACVMACGGLTALYATCEKLLIDAGVSADKVKNLLGPYMKLTIDNNTAFGSKRALTGPIARGDSKTVVEHEIALKEEQEEIQRLYRVLSELQKSIIG